jgi:intracellular multiplication protein IcmJ
MRSGVLVTFPEVSQADLNRLSVEIYVARTFQTSDVVRQANAGLELLMNTRETTRRQLGTDNPRELAGMLRACRSDAEHDVITKKLAGVRLFPLDRRILREADLEFNQFSQILRFWRSRSGPYPVDGTNALIRLKRFAETYL